MLKLFSLIFFFLSMLDIATIVVVLIVVVHTIINI